MHYCHNCRYWQHLVDGVFCRYCLAFFYTHKRLPTANDPIERRQQP